MKTEVGEDDIKQGLQGDENRQFEAICAACDRYYEPVAGYIRKEFPTLDSQDMTTAVADAFTELGRKAKAGNLKTDGSLKSLLFRMAWCNARDLQRVRRRESRRNITKQFSSAGYDEDVPRELSDEEVISLVAKTLSEAPAIASAWKVVTQDWTPDKQVHAAEIVRQFKMQIQNLPDGQRKVAEVMARHFGDATDQEICDEVTAMGESMPLGSVKSARREIRKRFESLIPLKERTETQ